MSPTFSSKPIFSWDNFLDFVYANPTSGATTYDGTIEQVESLASGRRSRNRTPWAPGSGADQEIRVDLGSGITKAANMVWLGDGHNYDGEDIEIERASSEGGPYTTQFSVTVGTDGKDLDDGSWCYLFEGTENSARYWRANFVNTGSVNINIPALWFGRMEQFSSWFDDEVDENAGDIWIVGEERSDRGVRSGAAARSLIHTLTVRVGLTDETANEFTTLLEPWQNYLAAGGLTLAAIDWPNNGEALRLYQLQTPRIEAPFKVRGRHRFEFVLEEVV